MKYLLPGSIVLAMFVSVMIGGGMLYIDDKARGVHEGYLVTPITKLELVFGLNLAGASRLFCRRRSLLSLAPCWRARHHLSVPSTALAAAADRATSRLPSTP